MEMFLNQWPSGTKKVGSKLTYRKDSFSHVEVGASESTQYVARDQKDFFNGRYKCLWEENSIL